MYSMTSSMGWSCGISNCSTAMHLWDGALSPKSHGREVYDNLLYLKVIFHDYGWGLGSLRAKSDHAAKVLDAEISHKVPGWAQ